jgi:hypothetical protein
MTTLTNSVLGAACCALLSFSVGCSSSDNNAASTGADGGADSGESGGTGHLSASAAKELRDVGVDKYFGKAKPVSNSTNAAGDTVYEFDKSDGPICLWGTGYHAIVRDQGSENLVIYLEGGGACWTGFCQANPTASSTIAPTGLLDPSPTGPSVVADWNVVYAPYCDGSVFSGDNELPDTTSTGATGGTRYHHGLQNLTAAVDLAKSKFPNAKRILLAGSSAGGYGTLAGTGVVRLQYPDADLIVFNDSGLGLSNPTDPTMYETLKADWKFDQYIPPSCTECQSGQQTALIAWGLKNDPSLRAAGFSSYADAVIGGIFLKMADADFKALLLDKTGEVHTAYPDRFERFLIEGTQHTTLLAGYTTTKVGSVTTADWTRAFVDGTSDWKDTLENGGK